ncbi:MAG: peptide permease [Thermoprotei archaeon]
MVKVLYILADKIYGLSEKRPGLEKIVLAVVLIAIAGLGLYLRLLPVINYGFELHANDPWIEYWQANYTYYHGILSWYSLTRDNPATWKFWYPWGRDFTTTSYPGLPIWTALTYHVAKIFGFTIKQWVVLQPIVFAALSYITLYLAVKEVSRNNVLAIIASFILYSVVPAASDRSIAGFVEKEGIALTFIFLALYFFSKLARLLNKKEASPWTKVKYSILTGLAFAMVGWFWGGFVYVLGSFIAFAILYPLFNSRAITREYVNYMFIIVLSALLFVTPSPHILKMLKLVPYSVKGIGTIMLIALILPTLYWLLANNYKKLGLSKPLLSPGRYFGVLVVILIIGLVLYVQGFIDIGARHAWALGLRALTPAPPLVQSIEEHQSPLSRPSTVQEMLVSWGVGNPWLLLVSPLVLAIFGAFYLIYKGGIDQIYLAIAFLIALYSYLNAAYMEATAAATGLPVAGIFIGFIATKILPSKEEVYAWKRGRVRATYSPYTSITAVLLTILIATNLVLAGIHTYDMHNRMIPSIMSGGAPISARNDAWYKAIDFIKENTDEDAVIVTWWDYGYWISVIADRCSVADGATFNGTQIRLLARLLTAPTVDEAIDIAKKLYLPPNNTYILVFDVFWLIPDRNNPNTYIVMPYYAPYQMVGLVDIPKSVWMIRIGERNIADYFYAYTISNGPLYISPRFDQPDELPLIYRIMVDGILMLNNSNSENRSYVFAWYTGMESSLDPRYRLLERELGVKKQVYVGLDITGNPVMKYIDASERPLANETRLKPFKVIVEPFEGIVGRNGELLVEMIFIYKLEFS